MTWRPPTPAPRLERVEPETHGGPGDDPQNRYPPVTLDLSTNVLPGGPDPEIAAAVATAPLDRYPDPDARSARQALAEHWGLEPDRVLIGPGASELIDRVARCWVAPGQRVVIAGPTFGEYGRATRLHGGHAYEVRPAEPQWKLDVKSVIGMVDRIRPVLVFVCSPNNPTGEALGAEALKQLVGALPHGTLLVLDESYRTFAEGTLAAPHRPLDDRVLHLRSFTKDLGVPGLRIAATVGAPAVLEPLRRAAPPWSVSAPALAALEAALRPEVLSRLERRWAAVIDRRSVLHRELTKRGWSVLSSDTSYLLARVPDADRVHARLRRCGIRLRRATSFGLPEHLRVGTPLSDQMEVFLGALDAPSHGHQDPDVLGPAGRGPDRLFLVRHGATEANRTHRLQGWSDLPLADSIRSDLAETLSHLGVLDPNTRVWSSDLRRALETAEHIAPDHITHVDRRLREFNFGAFEGQTHDELSRSGGTAYRAWLDDPESSPPPGGERLSQFHERVRTWWADCEPMTGTTIVIAHGGPLGVLLADLLPTAEPRRNVVPPPGGFIELRRDAHADAVWRIADAQRP